MNLKPWRRRQALLDPFQPLEDLQQEMNRMFDNFPANYAAAGSMPVISPAVDIAEDENQISVTADLPGMKKEDIDISVQDDILTLKGRKEEKKEEKKKNYVRSERYAGSFNRSFELPSNVDPAKVKATYQDGTLEIILPKKEEAKQKSVRINVE